MKQGKALTLALARGRDARLLVARWKAAGGACRARWARRARRAGEEGMNGRHGAAGSERSGKVEKTEVGSV